MIFFIMVQRQTTALGGALPVIFVPFINLGQNSYVNRQEPCRSSPLRKLCVHVQVCVCVTHGSPLQALGGLTLPDPADTTAILM